MSASATVGGPCHAAERPVRWAARLEVVLLRRLSGAIYRRSDPFAAPFTIAVCSALWVAAVLGVVALQARVSAATQGLPVPDVLPLYTPQDLYRLVDQYGAAGRRAFLVFALYDVFYPFVAYGFATLALVVLLRPHLSSHRNWTALLLLPAAGLIVELLEQAGFLIVLAFFPTRVIPLAWATSVVSAFKLILLLGLVLALGGLLSWRAASGVRRRTSR